MQPWGGDVVDWVSRLTPEKQLMLCKTARMPADKEARSEFPAAPAQT